VIALRVVVAMMREWYIIVRDVQGQKRNIVKWSRERIREESRYGESQDIK